MWHSANLGPLLSFESHFWHQPPTCLLHRISNKSSFSKWQCLRGTVFRHICVCSVWISLFEESNVNAKRWGGRRLWRCRVLSATHVLFVLTLNRGGLEGFRGLFPLRISLVLTFCHVLPGSYRLTSKVLSLKSVLIGFYSWASILSSAGLACHTKHTHSHIFCPCSNFWN